MVLRVLVAVHVIALDSVRISWVSQPFDPKLTFCEKPMAARRGLLDGPFQKKSCWPAITEQCAAVSRKSVPVLAECTPKPEVQPDSEFSFQIRSPALKGETS